MTEKIRLTFEVDTIQLFDAIKQMNGDFSGIGQRVVGVMLAPRDAGFFDHFGMAVYGIAMVGEPEIVGEPQ